jgi:hypothetical protein
MDVNPAYPWTRYTNIIQVTVIATATEYIHQLEERNARLAEERAENQIRLAAFEKVRMKMRAGRSID